MKKTFKLDGLGCANCAAKMEKAINQLDGVTNATVNFITTKMVLEFEDEKLETILASTEKIIKKIEPDVVIKKA